MPWYHHSNARYLILLDQVTRLPECHPGPGSLCRTPLQAEKGAALKREDKLEQQTVMRRKNNIYWMAGLILLNGWSRTCFIEIKILPPRKVFWSPVAASEWVAWLRFPTIVCIWSLKTLITVWFVGTNILSEEMLRNYILTLVICIPKNVNRLYA